MSFLDPKEVAKRKLDSFIICFHFVYFVNRRIIDDNYFDAVCF
jgi:hypothetical protein